MSMAPLSDYSVRDDTQRWVDGCSIVGDGVNGWVEVRRWRRELGLRHQRSRSPIVATGNDADIRVLRHWPSSSE
ncbi:hypothetical protein U1Q18_022163 [Sarracenia purpurea var. burkii]